MLGKRALSAALKSLSHSKGTIRTQFCPRPLLPMCPNSDLQGRKGSQSQWSSWPLC